MRYLAVLAVAGAAVVGACLFGAPNAVAETTSNCTTGMTSANFGALFPTVALGTSCANFADNGSPYTFDIGTLTVLQSLPTPQVFRFSNVVATCGGFNSSMARHCVA